MKALVVLLASVLCLGGLPAEAQESEQDQEIKVYEKIIRPEKRFMIYLSNLDGSGERELVEGSYPSLSPDQKHVAFVRESSLYRLEIETMAEKILLDKEEAYLLNRGPGSPQWHPDGRTIFFDMSNVFHYGLRLWAGSVLDRDRRHQVSGDQERSRVRLPPCPDRDMAHGSLSRIVTRRPAKLLYTVDCLIHRRDAGRRPVPCVSTMLYLTRSGSPLLPKSPVASRWPHDLL